MIIEPKIRGFICTTAHPAGCAENVRRQIELAKASPIRATKRILVLGASTGYGLASMIAAAFGGGAASIGVAFERPGQPEKKRTATAGWYNMAAFARYAKEAGLEHHSVIGDAFSDEAKDRVIQLIKDTLGQVDTVIYSLAAPSRTDPVTGERYQSVIKPIGEAYRTKSVNLNSWKLEEVEIQPATEEEIAATIKVMGGEDWKRWMDALAAAGALAPGCLTLAYDYVGPQLTYPIYHEGTIGRAKADLLRTAGEITASGVAEAHLSVNKAVVTQASAAIPAVPLYITMLFKTMKGMGIHEDCIQQMIRMFGKIDSGNLELDEAQRVRMDDWEMRPDVQEAVMEAWQRADDTNLATLADIEGYQSDFKALFGFGLEGVDYGEDLDPAVDIPGLVVL